MKIRKKGDKNWIEIEFPYYNPERIARIFADEKKLITGDIVEIFRKGKYRVQAMKCKVDRIYE